MNKPHSLYIGLMAGTSLDGIDAVLAKIGSNGDASALEAISTPFSPELRKTLFELQSPGQNELHREKQAGNALALAYADAVNQLLKKHRREIRLYLSQFGQDLARPSSHFSLTCYLKYYCQFH